MTTRALADLPEQWAAPILGLVDQARIAATPPVDDGGAWAAAEAGQTRFRTGFKGARRTASAGQLAAHLLRLRAVDSVEQGDLNDWTVALSKTAPAINSWDWDERMQAALDLRRTFLDADRVAATDARDARLVAAWLTHSGGSQLVPVTGRLCEYVLEHAAVTASTLAPAWYATHGDRLLAELVARGATSVGHPSTTEAAYRLLLRAAVCGVHGAKILTKYDLAERAGTTRMTLNVWLNAGPPPAPAGSAPTHAAGHAQIEDEDNTDLDDAETATSEEG